MEITKTTGPSPMGVERQRLLKMLGWSHGQALPQLVLGLLGWSYGTNEGRLIPGRTVYGLSCEKIAHFIAFYAPVREGVNTTGVYREDLNDVIRVYNPSR
jgi:hypothetical protein